MAQRPAQLDWQPCADEDGGAALIAYSQGYVCVVLHGGTKWAISRLAGQDGATVASGKNPPGPIAIERTASHVNRKFADVLKAK